MLGVGGDDAEDLGDHGEFMSAEGEIEFHDIGQEDGGRDLDFNARFGRGFRLHREPFLMKKRLTLAQIVFLEFAIECSGADAEDFCSLFAIAVGELKGFADELLLGLSDAHTGGDFEGGLGR